MTTLIPKYDQGATSAVNRPINKKLAESVSVMDFGAVGDGTTNDAPAFQAAINSGAKYIVIPAPPTTYLLTTSLNMTNLYGVTFDFQASLDINNNPPQDTPPIIAKHTGAVFDLTGSFDCCFINANVNGSSVTTPTCMFLLARTSSGSSAGRHRFFNPRSSGNFSTTVMYNYGSEENDVYSAMFFNNQNAKSCVYLTAYNAASLTSAFATIATGVQSTVCHRYYGGSFYSQGNSGSHNESCFILDSSSNLSIDGAFLYCPNGISPIYVSSANAATNIVAITNVRCEVSATLPTYNIYFSAGSVTYSDWRVTGCQFDTNGTNYAIYGENNIILDNFTYQNNISTNAYGFSLYTINNSFLQHGVSYGTTRNSGSGNVWIGNSVARTATGQGGTFISTDTDSVSTGTVITTQINASQSNYLIPTVDNTFAFGQASRRWTTIYASTGTINTSDRNEKTDIVNISDVEKRVAIKLKASMKRFKFKDGTRYHFGTIAQDVKAAFESEGLVAEEYGVFCSDTLENGKVQLGVRYDELFAFIIGTL